MPGRLVIAFPPQVVPCEAALVYGSMLMNEASLTGESTPMEKETIAQDPQKLSVTKNKSNFLYSGTTVISVTTSVSESSMNSTGFRTEAAYAVVTSIGTGTLRGNLLRGMFYPLHVMFYFEQQLFRAFLFMGSLGPVTWIAMMIILNPFQDAKSLQTFVPILCVGINCFSQLISPLIPALFLRAASLSADRLEAQGIPVLELDKVVQAGKVDVFCFDKTGTLTRTGLEFYGICTPKNTNKLAEKFRSKREESRQQALTGGGATKDVSTPRSVKSEGESSVGAAPSAEDLELEEKIKERGARSEPSRVPVELERDISDVMTARVSPVTGVTKIAAAAGYREVQFSSVHKFNNELQEKGLDSFLFGCASCHSLTVKDSDKNAIGNPLELETFQSVGWSLKPASTEISQSSDETAFAGSFLMEGHFDSAAQKIRVLRKWKFNQTLQLQVVICTTDFASSPNRSTVLVYAKGSVEAISKLCGEGPRRAQQSAPAAAAPGDSGEASAGAAPDEIQTFNNATIVTTSPQTSVLTDLGNAYSGKGFYVLGMAHAEIQLNWNEVATISLEEILGPRSGNFEFLGMMLYKNELRPESMEVIRDLHLAEIKTVMITGDSVFTGVAIAEQCGLVDQCPYIIIADESSGLPVWMELNHPKKGTSADLVQLYYAVRDRNASAKFGYRVSIGISDAAYNKIVSDKNYRPVWRKLQPFVCVYGRFKPDEKMRVVRDYQVLDEKSVVAMCGDGGNDSAALKQAHVGVALSHSHATAGAGDQPSMVAPFVAQEDDLTKVVTVLREGRCTMDSHLAILLHLFFFGVCWMIVGKIFVQTSLAWITVPQVLGYDIFLGCFLPMTFAYATPSMLLQRTTSNSEVAGLRFGGLLLALVCFSMFIFFSLVALSKGLASEPASPSLNVRTVEDPAPAWWTRLEMFKDDIL